MNPSYQQPDNFLHIREEISQLHSDLIKAHLMKNVSFFTENLASNFFFVSNGEISHPSPNELHKRMENYLGKTSFLEYRDLCEPTIGCSDDGSLAWSVVQVHVHGFQQNEDNSEKEFNMVFAWITLYHREQSHWLRLGEVSTMKNMQ